MGIFSNETLPFFTSQQKEEMIKNESAFMINSVKYRSEGPFGANWVLAITIANEVADQGLISFKSDFYRDKEMEALTDAIRVNGLYGPCKLIAKPPTKKGYKPTICLADIEGEEPPF
jgi:hypothetical protein